MSGLHGALVIDKPSGMTSFSAMRRAQRALGEKTAGHAGTLDPMATGVLVVLLGEATKLSNLLMDHDKLYEAEVTLGVETDTLDADGEVTRVITVPPFSREHLDAILAGFVGHHDQVPPRYSALKKDGRTHMSRARAGEDFEVASRSSICHGLELLAMSAPVDGPTRCTLRVHCGKGYYVRSLARDLGLALGTVAHLSALRRTRVGAFSLSQSVAPEDATASHVLPIPTCIPDLGRVVATGRLLDDLRCGRTTFVPSSQSAVAGEPITLLALTADDEPVALVAATPTNDGRLRLKVTRGFTFEPSS